MNTSSSLLAFDEGGVGQSKPVIGNKFSMGDANLDSLEAEIARHRVALDGWLDDTYDSQQPRTYNGELDCSYEEWHRIEAAAGSVFDNQRTQLLSVTALDSLLFFISRNEEVGRIIAWLGRIGPFSGVGDLTMSDFQYLCNASLSRPEDFSDYQLANCFHKLSEINQQHIDLLLRFFARNCEYTKRIAIDVLATKGFDEIPQLAEQLWMHDDCEFTKLSCLYALKTASNGKSLFTSYLAEFKRLYDVDGSDHLATHIERLEC